MKIMVTFEIDDDDPMADSDHPMGLTNEGYEQVLRALPGYDVDVLQVKE